MSRPRGSKNKAKLSQEEIKQQEYKEQQEKTQFAMDSFVGTLLGYYKSPNKFMGKIDKSHVDKMLLNPQTTYKELQQLSRLLKTKSGIYRRLVQYFSKLLTYDHLIYPVATDSKITGNKEKLSISYEQTALYLDKMNLKYHLPWFTEELFTNGEIYLYKLEDKDGIVYKQMESKYCRIISNVNGVFRYAINLMEISFDDITIYPSEIQNAYYSYIDNYNSARDKKKIEQQFGWYEVSNKGVAFSFIKDGGHGVPPFVSSFIDIMSIDDAKELQSQINRLENSKMIHNEVPVDSKTNKPALDLTLTKSYNEAIKKNLPSGIFSVTNPFKSQILNLTTNQQRVNSLVEEAVNQIFTEVGTSDMLFNNKKASSEALLKSISVDIMLCLVDLIPMYVNYINDQLLSVSKNIKWKIKILETTFFDRDDKHKMYREDLAYGSSRFMFMSSAGFSPLETINILKTEQEFNIDNLMIAKQTAHTMNGDNEGGRPTNQDKGIVDAETTQANKERGNGD